MQEKFLRVLGYETANVPAKKRELLGRVAQKMKDFRIKAADVRTLTEGKVFKVLILISDQEALDSPPWPGLAEFKPQDGVFKLDTKLSLPAAQTTKPAKPAAKPAKTAKPAKSAKKPAK